MKKKSQTVKQLAYESKCDVDEVLLHLWDLGLDHILSPNAQIEAPFVKLLRLKLDLPPQGSLRKVSYWLKRLDLNIVEFEKILAKSGHSFNSKKRTLTKSEMRQLSKEFEYKNSLQIQESKPAKRDEELFEWEVVGHSANLVLLSKVEVLAIYYSLALDFSKSDDPILPAGIKDENLLASAIFHPDTSIGGELKYPTVEMAAAALMYGITHNHPFYNGNKRTGLVSMLVFLDTNGFMLDCDEDELFKLVILLAQHKFSAGFTTFRSDREVLGLARWINERLIPIETGDRVVTWRKLKIILTAFGCTFEYPKSRKNRVHILKEERNKYLPAFFGGKRTLKTQFTVGKDGSELSINAIKKIREDLHLTDTDGCDSKTFYERARTIPADFIARYSKTLKRLARL